MINIYSNLFGHSEIYFFFFFFFFSLGISFPLPTEIEEERNKKLKSTSFTHFFSFRSLFLDQKTTAKLTWVLPTTSLCYIWYSPSLNNHKELGIAIFGSTKKHVCLFNGKIFYLILSSAIKESGMRCSCAGIAVTCIQVQLPIVSIRKPSKLLKPSLKQIVVNNICKNISQKYNILFILIITILWLH